MFNKKIFLLQILVLCLLVIIVPIIVVNMLLKEVQIDIDAIQEDIQRLYQNNSVNNVALDDVKTEVPRRVNDSSLEEVALDDKEINIDENEEVKSIILQYEEVQIELDLIHKGFDTYKDNQDIPEGILKKESKLQQKLDELFESL